MFDLIVKIRSLELVAITIATGYCGVNGSFSQLKSRPVAKGLWLCSLINKAQLEICLDIYEAQEMLYLCIVTGVPNKFDLIELGGCMRKEDEEMKMFVFSLCMVSWSWCSVSYEQFLRSKVHRCQDRNHQTVLFLQSNSLTSSWSSDCHETCYETHLHTLTPSPSRVNSINIFSN